MLAVFQKTGEGPVYVSETEQAEVIGLNLRSPQPATFVGQPRDAGATRWALLITLAHHRYVLGLYLVDHAHFAGLAVGIFADAEIFLGKLVDAGATTFFGDLNHAAADLEIPVGILRVH